MKTKKMRLSIENVAGLDFVLLSIGNNDILINDEQALTLAESLLNLLDVIDSRKAQPIKAAPALRVVGGGNVH